MTDRADSLQKAMDQNGEPEDLYRTLMNEMEKKTNTLNRYRKQLEILNQASVMINSVRDIPTILRTVTQAALELWNSDGGTAGIVEDGEVVFRDWYLGDQHKSGFVRCNILRELNKMSTFMEYIQNENDHNCSYQFYKTGNIKIEKCLAVPIHDRQLKVQACLLLFNPDSRFSDSTVIENPLPALISSAGTALDNTRNIMELRDKELALQSSLKEKDLLLKEIHHRVKNNLQAIVGLMEAHLGTIREAKDRQVFLKGQSVAMAMSMIHELLYSTQNYAEVNFGQYTERLVQGLLKLYPNIQYRIQVSIDMDEMFLNSDTAVPVSLIINELVSNALTHAFLDHRRGTIAIIMRRVAKGGFILEVVDDGIGISESENDPERKALGLNLVRSLVENLHGSMNVDVNEGTRVTLRFKEYFECEDLELG